LREAQAVAKQLGQRALIQPAAFRWFLIRVHNLWTCNSGRYDPGPAPRETVDRQSIFSAPRALAAMASHWR
jgi:hypothetical protein